MRGRCEEETRRNSGGRPHLQDIRRPVRRFGCADPRDGAIGRHEPHEGKPRQLRLPHTPELLLHAFGIDLRSAVALSRGGIWRLALASAAAVTTAATAASITAAAAAEHATASERAAA